MNDNNCMSSKLEPTNSLISRPADGELEGWNYCSIFHHSFESTSFRAAEVHLVSGIPAPAIRHSISSEIVRIIDGKCLVYLDGKLSEEVQGTTVFVPCGVAHGFKAIGENCHLFVVHVPAVPPKTDHEIVLDDILPSSIDVVKTDA